MKFIKNIKVGKVEFLIFFLIIFIIANNSISNSLENLESLEGNFIEITILDKVSSKNNVLKIKIGEEQRFKNLIKRFLNFCSSPIFIFKTLFFELTLSKILISIKFPSNDSEFSKELMFEL